MLIALNGNLNIAFDGRRYAPPLDLGVIRNVAASRVDITKQTPANTAARVFMAVTPGVYIEVQHGDPIPGITLGQDLTGLKLYTMQELSTIDTAQVPVISILTEIIGDRMERTARNYIKPVDSRAIRTAGVFRSVLTWTSRIYGYVRYRRNVYQSVTIHAVYNDDLIIVRGKV